MISIVVGLGNIGTKYAGSRHNLGFEVVNRVARKLEASRRMAFGRFESALARVPEPDEETASPEAGAVGATAIGLEDEANSAPGPRSHGRKVLLAWPTTFMNRSGEAVADLLERQEAGPENCLIVSDDFNLSLGAIRFRRRGSDGGHNGLGSIIETLGTEEFPRLRLGIGQPADKEEIVDFVLRRFEENELETVKTMLAKAAEAVIFALSHPADAVMAQFNSNPALPDPE